MKRLAIAAGALFLAVGFEGCAGNDPFSISQENANRFPELESPLPASFAYRGFGDSGSDGFEYFNFSANLSISAPGPGFVSQVDNTAEGGTYNVYIHHGPRLTSKVSRIPTATARSGDYVAAGAQIGSLTVAGAAYPIRLTVYVDGVAVCPLSYLTSASRVAFQAVGSGWYPCRQ